MGWRWHLFAHSLVFITCIACYYNSLWGDFVFDDYVACVENKDVMPDVPLSKVFVSDFWGTRIDDWQSHKSYRPLTVLSFRYSYLMSGKKFDPFTFHIVNVIGHAIVSSLVLLVAYHALPGCGYEGQESKKKKSKEENISKEEKEEEKKDGGENFHWGHPRSRSSDHIALGVALLYASHPIHTDSVSSIVSRSEVLSGVFFMLSYLLYCQGAKPQGGFFRWFWIILSFASAVISMLFKELGFTIMGIIVGHELFLVSGVLVRLRTWWLTPKREKVVEKEKEKVEEKKEGEEEETSSSSSEKKQTAAAAGGAEEQQQSNLRNRRPKSEPSSKTATATKATEAPTIVTSPSLPQWPRVSHFCAVLRVVAILGGGAAVAYYRVKLNNGSPTFKKVENPTSYEEDFLTRAMTYNWLLVLNFRQLSFPLVLMADYSNTVVPIIRDFWSDPRNIYTIIFWIGLIVLVILSLRLAFRGYPAVMMALGFLIIPFFPSTNLLFPVGFVVAERVLYLPSLGFCMLSAIFLNWLVGGRKRIFYTLLAVIVSLYTARCIVRNFDWSNQPQFWLAMMRDYPDSAKGHFGYANLLSRDPARVDDAMAMLHKSADLFPEFWDAYNNLGDLYTRRGQLHQAKEMFKKCFEIHPVRYESQYNVGLAHLNLHEYDDAYLAFDALLEWFPTNVDLYAKVAMCFHGTKSFQDELEALRTIVELDAGKNPGHLANYGKLAAQLGDSKDAEAHFRRALDIDGNHPDALYNLAGIALEKGKMKSAHELFMKAARISPTLPRLQELIDMTFDSQGNDQDHDENSDGSFSDDEDANNNNRAEEEDDFYSEKEEPIVPETIEENEKEQQKLLQEEEDSSWGDGW